MTRPLLYSILILLAVAAAFAFNVWLIDRKTRPAGARSGGVLMKTDVATANVKVEGDGPPIVLIHGFGSALDWWDEIAPQLAQDRKVIRLDLIGHGGTEAPAAGYDIQRQAALIKVVLDKLEIGRTAVIGHSMGGEVATAFTETQPDRVEKLVLIDSPPTPERSFSLLSRLAFTDVIGQTFWRFRTNAALRRGLKQGFAPGFAVPEKFVADLWQLTYTAFREAHDDSVAFTTERGSPARLAGLDPVPPLLVLFGSEDALISPQNAKRFDAVPGAKVVMIDGVGHSPMVEAPAKTLSLIQRFLNEDHRGPELRQ